MTHDELLAKVNNYSCCSGAHELALRAVVEIHKPTDYKVRGTFADGLMQTGCACGGWSYPCPTIQVIEEQLHGNV